MSRSRKKNLWVKDPANSFGKRMHARRMRRRVRQVLHEFRKHQPDRQTRLRRLVEVDTEWLHLQILGKSYQLDPSVTKDEEPVLPHPRAVTNQYDVCDYVFPCAPDSKWARK